MLCLTILITIPFKYTFSQNYNGAEVEKLFDKALNQYNSGDYNLSIFNFNKIIVDYEYNPKTTVSRAGGIGQQRIRIGQGDPQRP